MRRPERIPGYRAEHPGLAGSRAARSGAALLLALGLLASPVAPSQTGPTSAPATAPVDRSGPIALPDLGLRFGASAVAAASSGLAISSDVRYLVQPDKRRIVVIADVAATNRLADTAASTWVFDRANLALLPGASRPKVTIAGPLPSGASAPSVSIRPSASTYTLVSVVFGRLLRSGETIRFRLQYLLVDRGGDAARRIRVGGTAVAFPVWAIASSGTSGSTVTVVFPRGYEVSVAAGTLGPPTSSSTGDTILRSGPLAKPATFAAYVRGERSVEHVVTLASTTVAGARVALTFRAWPEEPEWSERLTPIFVDGLPLLATAIGLPFPGETLTIEESSDRGTGGYAGIYDTSTRTIRIAYDASTEVALHEAAHAWFNGSLLAERWASEAFAQVYAEGAERALGLLPSGTIVTPPKPGRFPLNGWAPLGDATAGADALGYPAAAALGRAILERAGEAGLAVVWRAAAERRAAYQADPLGTEVADPDPAPDWRVLLDLLEERTGAGFVDLWRDRVIRPEELGLLNERGAARRAYAALLGRADGWRLPETLRRALDAWQFEAASSLMDQVDAALDQRARVRAAAAALSLEPSPAARTLFEGAPGPLGAASEMDLELDTLAAIAATRELGDAAGAGGDRLSWIGLLGADPAADLLAARTAYETGDLAAAMAAARAAHDAWTGAADLGRIRVLAGLALLAALFVAAGATLLARRRTAVAGGGGDDVP